MKKTLYPFYGLLIFVFSCCYEKSNVESIFVYNVRKLDSAWMNNDSNYIRQWIENMDTINKFKSFVDRVATIAHSTNFCYGYLDVENNWDTVSLNKRNIFKNNIMTVYRLYSESCIFLNKKVPWRTTIELQDQYWVSDRHLNAQELRKIREQFNAWCHQYRDSNDILMPLGE